MTVRFWTFAKKANSTARPNANPAYTFTCTLKDASGVLRPVLEIYQSANFNPSGLNYAQIVEYGRYYFVSDWQWIIGRWEATLQVDSLATYKTEIGATDKYILRSASEYDSDIVDTFYPPLDKVNATWASYIFPWDNTDFINGSFVLGVITGHGLNLMGTTQYYILDMTGIAQFMAYMFPDSDQWHNFTSLNEYLYKSIYDPLQFIVSCKYFPFTISGENAYNMGFGNFYTDFGYSGVLPHVQLLGQPNTWNVFQHDYTIASDWLTRDAKYRSEPYTNVYFYLNPFGIIALSPSDFTLSNTVRVRIIPDLISGEATLQIFSLVNNNEILVQQRVAMLGQDVNLTADSRSMAAAVASLVGGVATGAAEMATGNLPLSGVTQAGNAALSMVKPVVETASRGSPSVRTVDGISRLYTRRAQFVDEKNAEFGKPLYKNRVINTLSGFIKCGDGDIAIDGYPEEVEEISNYLTGGFYYE